MIVEANDVVFAEVIAALHLYHDAVYLAWICKAVRHACRYVGRLIYAQRDFVFSIYYLGASGNHDPVLAAAMVILQRQRGAGLDHDALDLEARPLLEHGVSAPGAVHGAVQPRAFVALRL